MKGIFSKSGNKKDISGQKMDRRSSQQSHSTSSVSQSGSSQQQQQSSNSISNNGRLVNSFIPTSATYGHSHSSNGHLHHHSTKQVAAAVPMHHQSSSSSVHAGASQMIPNGGNNSNGGIALQQGGGSSAPLANHHYYSNLPSSTLGSVSTRQEHHYTNYQQSVQHHHTQQGSQQFHHQQQSRTLTKSYSASQQNNQQSHYGNTTTGHVVVNNNNNQNVNPYYGNASNLPNSVSSSGLMNGHHLQQQSSNETTKQNSQYNNPPPPLQHHHSNPVQHTLSYGGHLQQQQQQVHHHQQIHQLQNHIQVQSNQSKIHLHHQMSQSSSQYQTSTNSANVTSSNGAPNATEGLPSTLVESMRTLFDILDDTKQGKIRLSDIETRWENDSNGSNGKGSSGAEPLIKMGVLEYLRKVTPSDGMLTFDRFCSGLRLALLTNNNGDSGVDSSNSVQLSDSKYSSSPPQQFFQEHVKSITQQNSKLHASSIHQALPQSQPQPPQYSNNSNNSSLGNKSASAVQLPHAGQSNTIHRMSKIPSASRLPMPNGGGIPSGIPLSPPNRQTNANNNISSNGISGSGIPNGGLKNISNNHHSTLGSATSRRYNTNSEHTTIALVHPQPPPNPKPTSGGLVQPSSYNKEYKDFYGTNNGTYKMNSASKQNSGTGISAGFQNNRFSSRNSSLDDLKAPTSELIQTNNSQGHGERPPSAPILDIDANNGHLDENENCAPQKQRQHGRERAKSQERDRLVNGHGGNHLSRAEEKSNFVKSRQRTLSMPQLQLNKLKPKSGGVNFEDSPQEKIISQPSVESNNNYPRPSALKNSGHSTSKLISSAHNNSSSAIPTVSSTLSLKFSKGDMSSSYGTSSSIAKESYLSRGSEKESPEMLPPPPPKPPRNAMSGPPGPVTISTTLLNNATNDPPLSNSSFGSVQTQSSTATISPSTSSSTGGGNKPEIRTVLHTWQKSMTDKKPVEPSLSVTSIGTNSSVNTTDTTKSAPPIATATMLNKDKTNESSDGNRVSGDEVKAKSKSNLKRKDTARRHTVQSGIDFSTLKRLKQLEQERDVLQQGLTYLQKTHEWYIKQLEIAEEKIGLLNKGAPTADYWSESHEERLNLLGCRVSEVNSLLTALMDGSSRLPLHMNLQIPSHLSLRTITRLKDQNRQLTQEVSDYSHRVTQLENEKAMLLRQLFHQKNNSASDETVYM